MSAPTVEELRERFDAAGQGHVLHGVEALPGDARERYLAELDAIDLRLVRRLADSLRAETGAAAAPTLEPPEMWTRESGEEASDRSLGEQLLSEGKVGFVLVAGGQGSRLGFDGPKGAFEVGPVTDRCLFAWHAGRIRAAARRHGFRPTWYVMTSRVNDGPTRAFFDEHGQFGLPAEDVVFFSQDMLPALDGEGRIVLAAPGEVFLAPNGHGGTLAALRTSGALDDMRARGIEQLSYFQVDNPLARPADPLFLGAHEVARADMSSKVVAKRDADEKVGVIGRIDGQLGCIEYSDLSDELRYATGDDGALLFNAGNIAAHAMRREFVERLTEGGGLDLPWHVARKALKVVGPDGAEAEVAGVKFETFVFDALAKAARSVTLQVDRAEEFSPVKNAEGSDSPATCREDLTRIGREIVGADARDAAAVEVDPVAAETAAEYAARRDALVRETAGDGVVVRSAEA